MERAKPSVSIVEISCNRALSKSKIYGVDYSLNPYFGCEHACIYCYVPRMMPMRLKNRTWGSFVEVKVNIPRVLAMEVKRAPRGRVLVSSITDPYQPIEWKCQLTRRCIELLAKGGFEVVLLTKSDTFRRDLELMEEGRFEVGVTVTTLSFHKVLEPNAPPPIARLRALKEASERGFKTFLFLGPLIPGIIDYEVQGILELAHEHGAQYVIVDKLNTRGDVVRAMAKALRGESANRFMEAVKDRGWVKKVSEEIIMMCHELKMPYDFCFSF